MGIILVTLAAALALPNSSGTWSYPSLPAARPSVAEQVPPRGVKAMASPLTASGTYSLYGCQIYGRPGKPDRIVNANITGLSIDHNSATLMSLIASTYVSDGNDAKLEIPNLANSSTPLVNVGGNGGHQPPIFGNPWGSRMAWIGGQFQIEDPNNPVGHDAAGGGDGHAVVLDNQNCYEYQLYDARWSLNMGLIAYDGVEGPLNIPYSQMFPYMDDNVQAACIPLIGFTDYGPDFRLKQINHPVSLILPTTYVVGLNPNIQGVNYATGIGADGACSPNSGSDPSNCFVYGDIFRLKSSYACPSDALAALVCKQLQKRGAVLTDTGTGNLRMGLDSNGNDDTDQALWNWLQGLQFSNFDLIQRGSITG